MTFDSPGFTARGGPAVVEVAESAAIRRRPADAAPGIELRGVTHRYVGQSGVVSALEPIDLEVDVGSFVAILGPSGCGKTTLLRIVSGLLESTGGRVRLAGESPVAARRRRAIGWLAQEDGLLPWRRVMDNVALPLRLAGDHSTAAASELLVRVGLDGGGRQYPHELSGGMRQRVALARALVARPPFLLLDEPFAHLDELTRERLGDLLLDLRAEVSRLPRSETRAAATRAVPVPATATAGAAPTPSAATRAALTPLANSFSVDAPHPRATELTPLANSFSVDAPHPRATELTPQANGFSVDVPHPPTTLLVTHSVMEAVRLADRVVVLSARPGRIVADMVVELARPRREDQPGFGSLVRSLKRALGAA